VSLTFGRVDLIGVEREFSQRAGGVFRKYRHHLIRGKGLPLCQQTHCEKRSDDQHDDAQHDADRAQTQRRRPSIGIAGIRCRRLADNCEWNGNHRTEQGDAEQGPDNAGLAEPFCDSRAKVSQHDKANTRNQRGNEQRQRRLCQAAKLEEVDERYPGKPGARQSETRGQHC
jgi:hypothetical protein